MMSCWILLGDGLDEAFARRFQSVIRFEVPDAI
jgi:hypothetical protein